jgi:pilus assembly protein Flp/PilA
MSNTLKHFMNDESGATAIEYGLIAALVSVAAILSLKLLGTTLENLFTFMSGLIDDVVASVG